MAQNPTGGGTYFRDADGVLHQLEEAEVKLDPETRLLIPPKRLAPQPPKAPEVPVTTTAKK
jgi:hypothetical protein